MATLVYVASTETFVGKTAVCMGLLNRMRQDGFNFGYMKPVSVSAMHTSEQKLDEDASLVRETLGLETPTEQMAPVLITHSVVDAILSGQAPSFVPTIRDAYRAISHGKEVVVMEGTNTWVEGALVDLTADQVVNMFDAPVLLVCRYESMYTVDTILSVQRNLSNRVVGVLINQVEKPELATVKNRIVPFLESRNIAVMGLLPREPFLASVPVGDLADSLGGQFIGSPEWRDKIVESLMVGAMGAQAGLSYFRRQANKAVITGGDRVDLQLVSLETSTNALILTGNIRPALSVLRRAEEREVPIIVVPGDTLGTVERAEQLFGRIRFRQHAKLQQLMMLMDQHFDYKRLYDTLGLKTKG